MRSSRRTAAQAGAERPQKGDLIVQQSFPPPRQTTNPYLVLLGRSIAAEPGVRVRAFSWRAALTARYDVFHVHWPDILVTGSGPLKSLVRQALTVLLLLRFRMTGVPVVRTLHNPGEPPGLSRRQRFLLARIDAATTLWICLTEQTPRRSSEPCEVIAHGHYRAWFERLGVPPEAPTAGRIAYVGLIRPYKGVEALIEAFGDLGDPSLSLTVAGAARTPELAEQVRIIAARDPRVALELRYLSDRELIRAVSAAELVVLPYLEMHNSGGLLAALSLDRPVLVPDNPVNTALAAEVGDGWVYRYSGALTSGAIADALARVRGRGPDVAARPDLSAREWTATGRRHVAAYRRALEIAGSTA